ncbi:YHS domain protein [mine drainage metagenome]|uniref:YHS domain protein n=1 Tax=mine drainage metagenome TaxID=410659 RepID=A0A1J5S6V3_9ZZZZ
MGLHDLEVKELIDPVCGMPVNAASPHSRVHGGAMFSFCSESCRARFMTDPPHFVVITVPSRDAPELTPELVVKGIHDEPERSENITIESGGQVEQRLLHGGLRGLIASWFLAWREGRHAARTSRELLALYRTVSADHPGLANREIYKLVVMARNSCDATTANEVLECAEESFAAWPSRRDLTLCDVVHYLAVNEFLALHDGKHWIHSDTSHMVASRIPHSLCVIRRK